MTDMPVYMHFLYSTIATVGFSVFFNVPKFALIPAGLTGGIGWSIYYCLINATNNDILSNFLAAALVALISEILARKLKYPAILFVGGAISLGVLVVTSLSRTLNIVSLAKIHKNK